MKLIQKIKVIRIPRNTGKNVEPYVEIYQINKFIENENNEEIMKMIWTSENIT